MSRIHQLSPNTANSSQVELAVGQSSNPSAHRVPATLRLRAENEPASRGINQSESTPRRIRWSEDVIDNEGLGKKSSKVCCIYHKSRTLNDSFTDSESSDSGTSDSDTDNDSELDCHRRTGNHRSLDQRNSQTDQDLGDSSGRGRTTYSTNCPGVNTKRRKPSPNAYEKMPKPVNARR
ncbi:type 1 phosphatases regulator ypi1 [Aspergillus ellipticus CBS 707.79]|uniref:Type 1 phosphatases regulator n=1 Tax=Aspergillus ellipticus CBS 707.79 TaxID=1448320 RepID=A0A319DBQ3_9EURO|nr:type 1 phosphatases regulator ypi1 [Aspergillus ellipticus CBS 707.79]